MERRHILIEEAIPVLRELLESDILKKGYEEYLADIIYCLDKQLNQVNAWGADADDMMILDTKLSHKDKDFVERRRTQLQIMDAYSFGYKFRYDKEDNERCYDD